MSKKYNWEYIGGGTCFITKGSYICDDRFYNKKTKTEAVFETTFEAHFKGFPDYVKSLSQIKKRKGVRFQRFYKKEE